MRFSSLLLLLLFSCQSYKSFHRKAVVIDTHNDVLSSATMKGLNIENDLSGKTHSDISRLKKGGVDIQIFSIFCDERFGKDTAFRYALREMESLHAIVERNPNKMMMVTNPGQLQQAVEGRKLGCMMGVEGGHMIEESLSYLDSLYKRGARYLTLTWNNSTSWATSAADETVKGDSLAFKGLTAFGKQIVQTCWPGDAGPLLTWGLTVTRGPQKARQNLGIYRQQVIGRDKLIMRWLAHRGGALDYRDHSLAHPREPFPVAVALGADPATMLGAVTPVPDTLGEYQFAGLLRGAKTEIVKCTLHDLYVPAAAEIVLEGHIHPGETAVEGPFGDHTGYYNERERFPVFTVARMTHRRDPIYHTTYTGKPPDEPAVLGLALNEVFVPLLTKQFPEIVDFYLPPEGCSYRIACVSLKKQYPGHAKRVMFGVWSFLRQFMYTKFIIVTDDDVNVRDWKEVIWALSTRVDPRRDTLIADATPIDYLDFASPVAGLGSKMGIDATSKWPQETDRQWGTPIAMTQAVKDRVDALWKDLGL